MRVFNIPLCLHKKLFISIQNLFGINTFSAKIICKSLGFNSFTPTKFMSSRNLLKIKQFILEKFLISNELKQRIKENIKELIFIKSYRGFRHRLRLPVRGQRTRTNRMTQRNLS